MSQLNLLPAEALAALHERWIETAEQLIAAASTPEGRAGLARLPGFEGVNLDKVLACLGEVVGPDAQRELQQPAPGGKLGLVLPHDARRAPPASKEGTKSPLC